MTSLEAVSAYADQLWDLYCDSKDIGHLQDAIQTMRQAVDISDDSIRPSLLFRLACSFVSAVVPEAIVYLAARLSSRGTVGPHSVCLCVSDAPYVTGNLGLFMNKGARLTSDTWATGH